MKTPNYAHDFTQLDEVLLSQWSATRFEPELLAEALEKSLYAIIHHGASTGQKAGTIMNQFDAAFTLMNVFKRMHLQQIQESAA